MGNADEDRLLGGAGNDTLADCEAHNVFIGGLGIDSCHGGTTGSNSNTFADCEATTATCR